MAVVDHRGRAWHRMLTNRECARAQGVVAANKVIADRDALVTDPENGWIGADATKLPEGFGYHDAALGQVGYWHRWLAA